MLSTSRLAAFISEKQKSEAWRRAAKVARLVLTALIAGFLFYKLHDVGWAEVLRNLPASPWFYAVFLVNYMSLPLFETGLYHMLWRTGLQGLPVFMRKRVYNEAVMEYSGEAYFYLWAKRQTHLSELSIFKTVRDVNILSALAANVVAFGVLAAVLVNGSAAANGQDGQILIKALIVTGLLGGLILVLAVALRRRLLSLPARQCLGVSAVHMARIGLALILQILQWHFALPGIGLSHWFFFLAIQLALSRLPFLPSKDLVFAGVAISLAAQLNAPQSLVAGMFVACAALNLSSNVLIYIIAFLSRFFQRIAPGQPQQRR